MRPHELAHFFMGKVEKSRLPSLECGEVLVVCAGWTLSVSAFQPRWSWTVVLALKSSNALWSLTSFLSFYLYPVSKGNFLCHFAFVSERKKRVHPKSSNALRSLTPFSSFYLYPVSRANSSGRFTSAVKGKKHLCRWIIQWSELNPQVMSHFHSK